MPTILKRSTPSIARMRCWNTHSQASESAVDATYRSHALSSRVKSVSLCGESLAAVIFGSANRAALDRHWAASDANDFEAHFIARGRYERSRDTWYSSTASSR